MLLSNNVRVMRNALLILVASCCVCAYGRTKVPQNSKDTFWMDSVYVMGDDTLSVKYDHTAHKVEVLTKGYWHKKDSIDGLWEETYKDPSMQDSISADLKLVQSTMMDLYRNGIAKLSLTTYSSIASNEMNGRGLCAIYLIYSLSTGCFQDYGFQLTWYKPKTFLTISDLESVLNGIRNLQFQYKGDSVAIDKVCLKLMLPITWKVE